MTATIILQNIYEPILEGTGQFEAGAWSETRYELRGDGTSGPRKEIMKVVGYWKITVPVVYDWDATYVAPADRWTCRLNGALARVKAQRLPVEGFDPEGKAFILDVPYMREGGVCDRNPYYYSAIERVKAKGVNPKSAPDREFEKFFAPGSVYGDGPCHADFVEAF